MTEPTTLRGFLTEIRDQIQDTTRLARETTHYLIRGRWDFPAIFTHLHEVGVRSVFFVIICLGFLGAIINLQAGFQATRIGDCLAPSSIAEAVALPLPDDTLDYLISSHVLEHLPDPISALHEWHRVLRPGGKVIISQSNRCFPTKAITMWLNMNDRQHLELINGYFQYAGGFETPRKAFDITATLPGNAYRDPMFIVEAVKNI